MFMRHWMNCPITQTHGRLREWTIFTQRDGAPDLNAGAVCQWVEFFGRAALLDGVRTEPTAHEGQVEQMYTLGGTGVVIVDGREAEVSEGSLLRIPAGAIHQIRNTGRDELVFVVARHAPVKGRDDGPFTIHNWREDRPEEAWGTPFQGHWNHVYKGPPVGVHAGHIMPHKISEPHSHPPQWDEIWYLNKGSGGWHWMGQELQPQPPGMALLLDPVETHSLMNCSDEVLEYVYYCHPGLSG